MAQRLRCPGGRPSVSYERVKDVAVTLDIKYQLKATAQKLKKTPTKPRCSLPESGRGYRVKVACPSNDQSRARGRKPRARMLTVRRGRLRL